MDETTASSAPEMGTAVIAFVVVSYSDSLLFKA
jgi:hypothetical protein